MNEQPSGIIHLALADSPGIGNKARRLAQLIQCKPLLFSVPPGLVLLPGFDLARQREGLLAAATALGSGPFAVRSCGLAEDGAKSSMAGRFHTELFVAQVDLPGAVETVRASFGASLDTASVLLQQMIRPDYAGVLFTRSPENQGLATCEYSQGTAEGVVSGKVAPIRVDYGRWTGNLYPSQGAVRRMLSLVFLVGTIIEEFLGRPQDIEWAYLHRQDRLYILQSRDITATISDQLLTDEQERVASLLLRFKDGQRGKAILQNAAVREVVTTPSRLTRSLMERLYAPDGALGEAIRLIGFPEPKSREPYVCSVFGQLFENQEVGKKLFGFEPRSWWAKRRLKWKVKWDREGLWQWLSDRINTISPFVPSEQEASLVARARALFVGFDKFITKVYPLAYAATLLTQLVQDEVQGGSLTGQLFRDLSKLHNTGDLKPFLARWGHRSANDYELGEPRFFEDPARARRYATNFASFPWDEMDEGRSFVQLKELAKDRAIHWLSPLRQEALALAQLLAIPGQQVFLLDLVDIKGIADNRLTIRDIQATCARRVREEELWSSFHFGDELSLATVECLRQKTREEKIGLHGKMLSVRRGFSGTALHATTRTLDLSTEQVLIARHLEPELVGLFPESGGLVVDMGGVLSHAAIVARELDYPVLALPGASSTICDGDWLEVDADGKIVIRTERTP